MALEFIPKIDENDQQTLFEEKEESLSYSSLTPESQPRMIPEIKMTFTEDISKAEPTWEGQRPFSFEQRKIRLGFKSPPKPWLPPRLLQKMDKMKKTPLRSKEMVDLIESIAKISIDFYQVRSGSFIAIRFDGRIAESADTEIDLLLKIQGKEFDVPVFVWQVGSESFSGWRT